MNQKTSSVCAPTGYECYQAYLNDTLAYRNDTLAYRNDTSPYPNGLVNRKNYAYYCLSRKKLQVTKMACSYSRNKKGGSKRMLRSIQKAYEIIKADDKDTAITLYAIRTWCKEGKVKCLYAGTKVLVDMDSLLDYIALKK